MNPNEEKIILITINLLNQLNIIKKIQKMKIHIVK